MLPFWLSINSAMRMKLSVPTEFDTAPKDERIAFVQELWNRIVQDPEQLPISNEHKQILDERLDAYRANPRAGRPWSEVRDQLLTKLRSS